MLRSLSIVSLRQRIIVSVVSKNGEYDACTKLIRVVAFAVNNKYVKRREKKLLEKYN